MAEIGMISINLGLGTTQFSRGINNANSRLRDFEKTANRSFTNVNKSMNTLRIATLVGGFALLARQASNTLSGVAKMADGYTELNNKMKLVYSTASSSTRSLNSVYEVAVKTAQSVDSVGQVYQRFAQNADRLGLSQAKVASLTETVSKAVAISGASTASAEAALTQFGQALASGVLRGEELNSIMEQTPGLSQAIADGLGIGVGELRAWGQAGKLSANEVVSALTKVKANIDNKFNTKTFTISESFLNLSTTAQKTVGEFDKLWGVSNKVASAINVVAEHIETIAKLSISVGAGLGLSKLTKYAVDLRNTAIENARVNQESLAVEARQAQLSVAQYKSEMNILLAKREQLKATLQEVSAKSGSVASGTAEALAIVEKETRLKSQLNRVEERLVKSRENLTTAYNSHIVAQGRYSAGLVATSGATSIFTRATRLAVGALNSLKVAFMSNPIGFIIGALTTAISVFTLFTSATDKAREATDELTNAVETGFSKLDKLGKAQKKLLLDQTEDLSASLRNQLAEQAKTIDENTKKIANYKRALATTLKTKDSDYSKQFLVNSLNKKIADSTRAITKARAEQEKITAQLTDTQAKSNAIIESSVNVNAKVNQKAIDFNAKLDEQRQLLTLTGNALLEYKAKLAVVGAGLEEGTKDFANAFAKQKEILELQENKRSTPKVSSGGSSRVDEFKNRLSSLQSELRQAQQNLRNLNTIGVESVQSSAQELVLELQNGESGLNRLSQANIARLKQVANAIDEVRSKTAESNADIARMQMQAESKHAVSTYGMSEKDKNIADFNFNADSQLPDLSAQMGIEKATQKIAEMKQTYLDSVGAMEQRQFNPTLQDNFNDTISGMKAGFESWGKSAMNVSSNVQGVAERAIGGMANALTQMVISGKADFKGLAVSILTDITQMIMKMLVFKAIQSAFGYADGGYVVGPGVQGYASGGYTGHGGKYTPAGVVHKGEYVMTKEATSRIGLGFLNRLNYGKNNGYANGGAVDVSNFNPDLPKSNGGNINVTVINNGETAQAKVKSDRDDNGDYNITIELVKNIAKSIAHDTISNNLRPGGLLADVK